MDADGAVLASETGAQVVAVLVSVLAAAAACRPGSLLPDGLLREMEGARSTSDLGGDRVGLAAAAFILRPRTHSAQPGSVHWRTVLGLPPAERCDDERESGAGLPLLAEYCCWPWTSAAAEAALVSTWTAGRRRGLASVLDRTGFALLPLTAESALDVVA